MRLRSVACCLALVAIVRASAPGTEKPEPVQALDPITVTAMPLPLVKLDLGFHLSTGRFASAAVAEGGYIYVIGGGNNQGVALDDVLRFDPRTGRSEFFAKLKSPRRNHRAVAYLGKIYVLGGYNGRPMFGDSIFEASMEVIDLATREVSSAPPMPVAKAGFACAISGGKLYVLGGAKVKNNGSIATTNSVEAYDLAKRTWSNALPMPTPRMGVAVNVEGFIIVPGGVIGRREVADVEVFNPRDNIWRTLPPLDRKVNATSLAFLDHYLFLFGPRDLTVYEMKQKQSTSYRFNYEGASDAAAVIMGGNIFVIGGRRAGDPFSNDYFRQPTTNWTLSKGPGDDQGSDVEYAPDDSRDINGLLDYQVVEEIQVFALNAVTRGELKNGR